MKKTLLFIMALLVVGGTKAQDTYDFDLTAASWGWSWNVTPTNDGGILKGTIKSGEDQGTVSAGWDPAQNWSRYNKIVAVIEKYTGTGNGAIQIKNSSNVQIAQKYFSATNSQITVTLDYNPADFASIRQLEFYLSGTDAEIEISRVYLEETYKYATTGTTLTYDEWGNVGADQFDGMTDETKVVFTYTLTMNGSYKIADYQGWGLGKIHSAGDNDILVTEIKSKSDGDVDVVVSKGDLNAALADENTQYHYYAVNFAIWNLGSDPVYGTTARKSVKAYQASAYATISTIGWSSFSAQAPLDFSESEVEAYIATSADENSVTLKKVSGTVAAGTGLLLKGTAGQKYFIPTAVSGTDYSSTNHLVAAPSETTITSATAGDNYVLSVDNSSNPIFAKVDNDLYPATVGAGKAYLHFDVSPSRTLTFNIEDEATGINETKGTKVLDKNVFFNLAGQRISQPTKGMYIVNGKKVIIK